MEDAAIVVRAWTPRVRRRIGDRRLFYVIDDDVEAGIDEPGLPSQYRERLRRLRDESYLPLIEHAERVLVPSEALAARVAARIGAQRIGRIDPALLHPVSPLAHHDRPLHLLFAGTRSHLADFATIWPAVAGFLDAHSEVRLTTYLGPHGAPFAHSRVEHRAPQPWHVFRAELAEQRFHVLLLPAEPTAFNAARSWNKLLEAAVYGAVPLVSPHLPFAGMVDTNAAGLVAHDWRGPLDALRDPDLRLALARANNALAERIGDPDRLRAAWLERLKPPSSRLAR